MALAGQHPILETRLRELATRIESQRQKLVAATGARRLEAFGAIKELEDRHAELADRLHKLEREAPAAGQGAREELEAMVDDLTTAIEDSIMRLDARSGRTD